MWGVGSSLMAKKGLEARGRAEDDFIALSPSRATTVAETFLFFLPLLFLLEPAAWAQVGRDVGL